MQTYLYTYIDIDDTLIYTFHLALGSPIKISISYISGSHIIELKLEIKLIYSLHLNRLLNFLRQDGGASCICCPKLVNFSIQREMVQNTSEELCSQKARLPALNLPPNNCLNISKLLHLSEPQFLSHKLEIIIIIFSIILC